MQRFGFFLSILFHAGVAAVALFAVTGNPVKVDLERPVYTVDIVSLAPPAAGKKPLRVTAPPEPPKAPKPEQQAAPPVQEIKPEPESRPSPPAKPKPVEPDSKKISEKEKKIITKKKKPKPKPKPEKKAEKKPQPQKTAAQLRAEAMKDVRKRAQKEGDRKKSAIQKELASIRKQAGDSVYADGTEGSAGGGQGTGSGLSAAYASIVGEAVRINWRYPALAGDKNLVSTVEIEIATDGRILGSRIVTGSRNPKFDASILQAIKETEFVESPPTVRDRIVRINFNSQDLPE